MYIETLLSSLLLLFLMVVMGYFIKKAGLVSDRTVEDLSRVLLTIILPLSIIASGCEKDSSVAISDLGLSFLIISLVYISFFLVSYVVLKLFVKDRSRLLSSVDMCVFANTSFIGYPLVNVLFGSEGMIFCVVYNLLYNVFMFSIGVRLYKKDGGEKENIWKMVLDPLSIASILAIVLFLSPFSLPPLVKSFLSSFDSISSPLSMMIVGSWLIGADFKSILMRPLSYLVSLLRLLVLPILVLVVLSHFGISEMMRNTIVLVSALPVGTLNVIFAKKYGNDVKFVNETMVQSLCLSMVTIPLIVLLF